MTPAQAERAQLPVVGRLRRLADEFDHAADYYARFDGSHNDLLCHEAQRAAIQLRHVAGFVVAGRYSQRRGADWLKAGWRIITAIGRANVR